MEDGEEDDALSWINKQKQKQKEIAELKRKQLEEMDREVVNEYKSENLKGLKIGHDISEFDTGEEQILVLKDSIITEDNEGEDELTSIKLSEKEKLDKNLELKKKKNVYSGYDEDDVLGKKNILSQYDDDSNNKGFVLDNKGGVFDTSIKDQTEEDKVKMGIVDLNYNKMQEINDYYTKEEMVSFKKPKKKKKKKNSRRRRELLEEDTIDNEGDNIMQDAQEQKPIEKYSYSNITTNIEDVNFIDDDDLQVALAKARRTNTKKKMLKSVEEIAEEAKSIKDQTPKDDEDNNNSNVIVLSDTSEFIRNVPTVPLLQQFERKSNINNSNKKSSLTKGIESTTSMDKGMNSVEINKSKNMDEMELEEGERIDDDSMDTPSFGATSAITSNNDVSSSTTTSTANIQPAIEEEPLISKGMAATVSLLLQKGFVNPVTEEELEREKIQREKEKWLNEQKINDIIREKERQKERERKEKYNRSGRNDRDRERDFDRDDIYRERERAREAEKKFKNYKPDVNIQYHDEFGNPLTPKEAFRQLSHKFHGKESGKIKTEKRLKKLEEEMKLKQMSSTDTPLGTVSALQEKTKALGSAHLVLSIGNRGVLPSEVEFETLRPRTDVSEKKSNKDRNGSNFTSTNMGKSSFVTAVNDNESTKAPKREKIVFGLKRKPDQEISGVFKKRE